MSNPDNQNNTETAPRLLEYLQRHKHWSPFEMAHAVFQIVTTRDIARQMLRHRSFSFQEFSQRYASPVAAPPRRARRQDNKNRQNSIDDMPADVADWWIEEQETIMSRAEFLYAHALRKGIAKECARAILPEGLTESTLLMAGSFRSWLHYLEQRCDPSTQLEHREVAQLIGHALAVEEPDVFGLWRK